MTDREMFLLRRLRILLKDMRETDAPETERLERILNDAFLDWEKTRETLDEAISTV